MNLFHQFVLNHSNIEEFSYNFAMKLKIKDVVTFTGDLGTGKTTICRNIIQYYAGKNVIINSPTFNISSIYDCNNITFYHYDLYRLKDFSELYELGFEEALEGGICLIEWPNIINHILPKHKIEIRIQYIDEYSRLLDIQQSSYKNS